MMKKYGLVLLTVLLAACPAKNQPVEPIKAGGETITITVHVNTPSFNGDKDVAIPAACERLRIGGGPPLTVTNIRGLEKLTAVKQLILYNISDRGGVHSDVTGYVGRLAGVEELYLDNCRLSNLDFMDGFANLRVLFIRNFNSDTIDTFTLTKNNRLQVFCLVDSVIKGQGNNTDKQMSVPIVIKAPVALTRVVLDTNHRALTLDEMFLESNKSREVYVSAESYRLGMNNNDLAQRYRNVHIIPYADLEKQYPAGYQSSQIDAKFHDGSFAAIGD